MRPSEIRVAERYYATGVWKAETALHFGGQSRAWEETADMVLLRGSDGKPFIPGASLAGAARSLLREPGGESAALTALFGGDPDGTHKRQYASALTAYDARLPEGASAPVVAVRDGVRIDSSCGIAMNHCKYDLEVLPAGTAFELRFLLTVYDQATYDVSREELLACFRAVLEGFARGEIRLGARTSRGLGRGKVGDWDIYRLSTGYRQHLVAWLGSRWQEGDKIKLSELPEPSSAWRKRCLQINTTLRLKTSLLNRSSGTAEGEPDMVHLSENGQPLLTGSSLAGALRARCRRIAAMSADGGGDELVAGMFGPLHDPNQDPENQARPRASRVRVEESTLVGADLMVQGRVAIDRFTGGALESALFDEAPAYPTGDGASVAVNISLVNPTSQESAVLLLAFKDLWLGDLALNGETAVGRGVFTGVWASIEHPEFGRLEMRGDSRDPAKVVLKEAQPGGWRDLNEAIRQWRGKDGTQNQNSIDHAGTVAVS